MKASTRILRVVLPENGGPRSRAVLDGLARHHGADRKVVDELIRRGELVKYSDKRHARWGAPKAQRGIATMAIVYIVAAIALVGVVWGAVSWHARTHFERGENARQLLWDQANQKAAALERARQQEVSDAVKEREEKLAAASVRAITNETKWKEELREANRNGEEFVVCNPGPDNRGRTAVADAGAPAAPAGAPAAGGLRFTWEFVRLYDSAWTGPGGESVFGAAPRPEAAAGSGAASPYTAGELIEVHGENARRASTWRREYEALVQKIRDAEAAWNRRSTQ